MSLILEALKKSEAKRRLGEAPDLGTPFATAARRRSPLPFIAAAIVIAGLGWWLLRAPPAAEKAAPPEQAALSAPPPPAVAATLGKPMPPARPTSHGVTESSFHLPLPDSSGSPTGRSAAHERPATAPPVAVAASAAPPAGVRKPEAPPPIVPKPVAAVTAPPPGQKKPEAAVARAPATELKTAPPPVAAAMPRPAPNAATATNTTVANAPPTSPPAQPAVASPGSSAQPYNELPFSVRKDLPAIKLSMHVYAPDPAQRFVILNDSRMVEGDAQEDLGLREIRPDGVVFDFRGQRFFYPRDGL
jgi:general secretion pathway protein B